MEDDLGVVLFERHNRKVVLTKTGAYLKKELAINLKNITHTLNHAKIIERWQEGRY